jgi:hypothetical protein
MASLILVEEACVSEIAVQAQEVHTTFVDVHLHALGVLLLAVGTAVWARRPVRAVGGLV